MEPENIRYIVLRTQVTAEGTLAIYGLREVVQRASGFLFNWVDFREAKTNCSEPDKCDLLSFGCAEEVLALLDSSGMVNEVDISSIGVRRVSE